MRQDFEAENKALRQQLDSLLQEARRNEEKMRRFSELERQLIAADSLPALLHLLCAEYQAAFGVECVSLYLVDADNEVATLLESDSELRQLLGVHLLPEDTGLRVLYGDLPRPRLGRFEAWHQPLFNSPPGYLASAALLPLERQGSLIGSLHFGSVDSERYVAGCGTDFLERLAAIIAVCLDNALARERLKQVGLTDGLTGVHNRRYFEHRCLSEVSQAGRYRYPLTCMFLDIDRFKRINDTYGHQTGDEVLREVAARIKGQLRGGDTIARYGGEEFVVLMPRTPGRYAREVAERVRRVVGDHSVRLASGDQLPVTISIGCMTTVPETAGKADAAMAALIAAADKALYEAKHGGRNRVVHAGPLREEQSLWRRWLLRCRQCLARLARA